MKLFISFILIFFNLQLQAQALFMDTAKWQILKSRLQNSSIIGIGEESHGYESMNATKAKLVTVLQKETGVHAITFESSFIESIVCFYSESIIEKRAEGFLYPFWNTGSVIQALRSFGANEQKLPLITGFDIQEDCRFSKFSRFLVERKLVLRNRNRLQECDSVLSCFIGKNAHCKGVIDQSAYLQLLQDYELIRLEIKETVHEPVLNSLLDHCIKNRKWLCTYLTLKSLNERMYYRDSLMAVNIAWLQKELYNGRRIIVWAANTHIARTGMVEKPKWMGEWLSSIFEDRYFAISLEKGRSGEQFLWEGTTYRISSSRKEKFNLIVYPDSLNKIKPVEWITPCDD